jgi:hypothetical protein
MKMKPARQHIGIAVLICDLLIIGTVAARM